jgi:hypothetical protein
MDARLLLAAGTALGVGTMFLFDPAKGKRRRAMARDQAVHFVHRTEAVVEAVSHDVPNRTHGIAARLRSRLAPEAVDDRVLAERIRAKLGRLVSHPGALDVEVLQGFVTLKGPILAREVDHLLSTLRAAPAVVGIDNRLDIHQSADHVSALQGGKMDRGSTLPLLKRHWSPTTRVATGLVGAGLTAYGGARHDFPGTIASLAGLGLGARAVTNRDLPLPNGFHHDRTPLAPTLANAE